MKKKYTGVVTNTCHNCPFCKYDPKYGMSYDSGYDCNNGIGRIANDCTLDKYREDLREWEKSQETLFPKPLSEKPVNPMLIPTQCPLEDVDENEECTHPYDSLRVEHDGQLIVYCEKCKTELL